MPKDYMKTHLPSSQRGLVEKLWVETGAQYIDGVWKQMKNKGLHKTIKAEDGIIELCVREFQWHHWNAENDKWLAAGEALHSVRAFDS